jgi:hypothetical protein
MSDQNSPGSSRQSPGGIYDWLIPVVLGFLALVLLAIIIAIIATVVGLWPISS